MRMWNLLHAGLGRLGYFETMVLTGLSDLEDWDSSGHDALEPKITRIERRQFSELSRDPEVQLEPGYRPEDLPASSECLAVLDENRLAAFAWFSLEPVSVLRNLLVELSLGEVYMHGAFTAPRFRGRKLYPRIMAEGFRRYCARQGREMVSLVSLVNQASLRAQVGMGWREVGRFWVLGRFGHYAVLRDARCRERGLQLRAAGSMPVHQFA